MSGKFHINPETGKAGTCTASVKPCKYGADTPHFASPEDAQLNYELKMADQVFATHTKTDLENVDSETENLANAAIESHQNHAAAIYTVTDRLVQDAESDKSGEVHAPTLKEAAGLIDEAVESADFSTLASSRKSIDYIENVQSELNRRANEEQDPAKATALWRVSESVADVLIKLEY